MEIQVVTLEGTGCFDELMSGLDEELRPLCVSSLTYGIAVGDTGLADASGALIGGFFGPLTRRCRERSIIPNGVPWPDSGASGEHKRQRLCPQRRT